MVMDREQLLEKRAKAAGLPALKVEWKTFDGGNVINDAMLAGALDIAGIGVPGFLTLWAKAKDNPAIEVRALTGMSSSSMYLMTRNSQISNITLDITFTTRRFVEANPKLAAAFVAAMEDACLLIANDRRKAAEI